MSDKQVTHTGGDTAVDNGCHAGMLGEFVEFERVLGKEGDIHHVLAGLDDCSQRSKSEKSRNSTDHEVGILNRPSDGAGQREVDTLTPNALRLFQPSQLTCIAICDTNIEPFVSCQIDGHGASYSSRSKYDCFHHGSLMCCVNCTKGAWPVRVPSPRNLGLSIALRRRRVTAGFVDRRWNRKPRQNRLNRFSRHP